MRTFEVLRLNRFAPTVTPEKKKKTEGRLKVQCIQLFFSQILFDFKKLVSRSISPKFSGEIPYVLSKPRICFLGSKDKPVLF